MPGSRIVSRHCSRESRSFPALGEGGAVMRPSRVDVYPSRACEQAASRRPLPHSRGSDARRGAFSTRHSHETEGAQSPRGRGRSRDWNGGLTLERPRPRGLRKRRGQFHLGMTGRSAARGALTHYVARVLAVERAGARRFGASRAEARCAGRPCPAKLLARRRIPGRGPRSGTDLGILPRSRRSHATAGRSGRLRYAFRPREQHFYSPCSVRSIRPFWSRSSRVTNWALRPLMRTSRSACSCGFALAARSWSASTRLKCTWKPPSRK